MGNSARNRRRSSGMVVILLRFTTETRRHGEGKSEKSEPQRTRRITKVGREGGLFFVILRVLCGFTLAFSVSLCIRGEGFGLFPACAYNRSTAHPAQLAIPNGGYLQTY